MAAEWWVWLVTGFRGEKEGGLSSLCSFLAVCSEVYFWVYYKPMDSTESKLGKDPEDNHFFHFVAAPPPQTKSFIRLKDFESISLRSVPSSAGSCGPEVRTSWEGRLAGHRPWGIGICPRALVLVAFSQEGDLQSNISVPTSVCLCF